MPGLSIELLPFFLSALYVVLTPFNKVEESFHLQATHDLLVHGSNIGAYDHHEFPGVVPRTFLGAVYLALVASPWKFVLSALGAPKILLQVAVRIMLAGSVCASYVRLLHAVSRRLGRRTAKAMVYVIACTPHFLFYASRTLPNTFAVLLVLHAVTEWMLMDLEASPSDAERWSPPRLVRSIAFFVCAILWLRCDMLVLLGPVALSWLLTGRATFPQLIFNGVVIGALSLATTVGVDSVFWQRLLWPEGVVLWFNAVENRSHEYGVSPWHWYFTSALPRALMAMLLFIPAGLVTISPKAKTRMARESALRASTPRAGDHAPGTPAGAGSHTQQPETAGRSMLRAQAAAAAAAKAVASSSSAEGAGSTGTGASPTGPSGNPHDGVPSSSATLSPAASHAEALEDVFWARNPPASLLQLLARLRPDWDVLVYFLPGLAFVALYSVLPHKELRFLLPGMPLFHIAAGRGLTKVFRLGEALLLGLGSVRPAPEVRAAELLADSVESLMDSKAPAVAAVLGSPRAALRRRRQPGLQVRAGGETGAAPASAGTGSAGGSVGSSPPAGSPSSSATGGPAGTPRAGQLSVIRRLLGLSLVAFVIVSVCFSGALTAIFVRVSMDNYPGGEALQRLYSLYAHDLTHPTGRARLELALRARGGSSEGGGGGVQLPCPRGDVTGSGLLEWWRQCADAKSGCPPLSALASFAAPPPPGTCVPPTHPSARQLVVHIDVASAESGVSRYGQAWSGAWVYDKTEGLTSPDAYRRFDFLLTENATFHSGDFDVWESVPAFVRVDWRRMALVRQPRLFIMRRKPEPARRRPGHGAVA